MSQYQKTNLSLMKTKMIHQQWEIGCYYFQSRQVSFTQVTMAIFCQVYVSSLLFCTHTNKSGHCNAIQQML